MTLCASILLAAISTTTNNLFVALPPWVPTNAPPAWVPYGNWSAGRRVGPEFFRMAETNAAAVMSSVDGYYEREFAAPGDGVAGVFTPGGGNFSALTTRADGSVTNLYAADVADWKLAVHPSRDVRREWDSPPRIVENSIRLLSHADTLAVADLLAGVTVSSNGALAVAHKDGSMAKFGSPWLDRMCDDAWQHLPMPFFPFGVECEGVTPTSFYPFDGSSFYTGNWAGVFPTWDRVALGDGVYPCPDGWPTDRYDVIETPWAWAVASLGATDMVEPPKTGVAALFGGTDGAGRTFAAPWFWTHPIPGHDGGPFTASEAFATSHCATAVAVCHHLTNRTVRLDRERQGAISMCEAACRWNYLEREMPPCFTGNWERVKLGFESRPYGTIAIDTSWPLTVTGGGTWSLSAPGSELERTNGTCFVGRPCVAVEVGALADEEIDGLIWGGAGVLYLSRVQYAVETWFAQDGHMPWPSDDATVPFEVAAFVDFVALPSAWAAYGSSHIDVWNGRHLTAPEDWYGMMPSGAGWAVPDVYEENDGGPGAFDVDLSLTTLQKKTNLDACGMTTGGIDTNLYFDWAWVPHPSVWERGFVRSCGVTWIAAAVAGVKGGIMVPDGAVGHRYANAPAWVDYANRATARSVEELTRIPHRTCFGSYGPDFGTGSQVTFAALAYDVEARAQTFAAEHGNIFGIQAKAQTGVEWLATWRPQPWAEHVAAKAVARNWTPDPRAVVAGGQGFWSGAEFHIFGENSFRRDPMTGAMTVTTAVSPYGAFAVMPNATTNRIDSLDGLLLGDLWIEYATSESDLDVTAFRDGSGEPLVKPEDMRCRCDSREFEIERTDWNFRNLSTTTNEE